MNKQEFLPNASLDHWLREHADGSQMLPSADGWDQPSEQVWTAVQAGLRRRKRRRLVFFWWLSLGAVLGGGAVAGSMGRYWKGGFEAKAIGSSAENQTGFEASHSLNRGASPEVNPTPNPSPEGEVHAPAGSKLSSFHKTIYFQQQPKGHALSEGKLPALSGEGLGVGSTPGQGFPSSGTAILNNPAVLRPVSITPETKLSVNISTPENLPVAIASRIEPSAARVSPESSVAPTLLPFSLPLKNTPSFWTFGASGGYFFTTRTLRAPTGDRPNGTEHGAWTWQGGFFVRRNLHRYWSLESGLQWTAIGLQAERSGRVRFRSNQERYDPSRDVYQTTARQQMETSFGAVDLRFDISRRAGQAIDDQEIIRLSLNTDEQVRYLRMPLALRYTNGRGRWHWGAQFGGGLSWRTGYALYLKAGSSDRLAIVDVQARAERRAAGLAPLVGDVHLAFDLDYQLTPRIAFHLAPEIRHGFTSLYRNGPFASYPLTTGLQAGFTIKLK